MNSSNRVARHVRRWCSMRAMGSGIARYLSHHDALVEEESLKPPHGVAASRLGRTRLAVVRPDLVEDWIPEMNDVDVLSVVCGDGQQFWWSCAHCSKEYQATIAERLRREVRTCPHCHGAASRSLAKTEETPSTPLRVSHPELCHRWDTHKNGSLTADDVTSASTVSVWWLPKVSSDGSGSFMRPVCSMVEEPRTLQEMHQADAEMEASLLRRIEELLNLPSHLCQDAPRQDHRSPLIGNNVLRLWKEQLQEDSVASFASPLFFRGTLGTKSTIRAAERSSREATLRWYMQLVHRVRSQSSNSSASRSQPTLSYFALTPMEAASVRIMMQQYRPFWKPSWAGIMDESSPASRYLDGTAENVLTEIHDTPPQQHAATPSANRGERPQPTSSAPLLSVDASLEKEYADPLESLTQTLKQLNMSAPSQQQEGSHTLLKDVAASLSDSERSKLLQYTRSEPNFDSGSLSLHKRSSHHRKFRLIMPSTVAEDSSPSTSSQKGTGAKHPLQKTEPILSTPAKPRKVARPRRAQSDE